MAVAATARGHYEARSITIRVRDLRKEFYSLREQETVVALDMFSLDVEEGEFICLVGPSGCGKSTLLRLVAGLDTPSAGELLYKGRPIAGPGAERGMAFQAYALFPWMTVRQNIEFGPWARGVPAADREAAARRFIEMVGLVGFENKYPHELSGGMQQRAALARVFANDPSVLLMDEPLAAVDAQTREFLQEELLNLWEATNKTVVFVTHSIQEAVFLADRVVIVTKRPGQVKAIVSCPLPRPRTYETRAAPDYGRIVHEVGTMVRAEIGTQRF